MSDASAGSRARTAVALGVVLLAALLVRLPGLAGDPLWLDEANTVLIAQRSFGGIVDALSRDGNPPLFYFLLHGWMALCGDSEAAARSLPLLFGMASIVAAFWASLALFPGRRFVALAAATLVAVGPLHAYYCREARMYTLTPLLGVLALWALHDALERGRARSFATHAALLAAGLYTHNYFLFVVPVGPVAALLAPGRLGRKRAVLAACAASAAAAALYAPWAPILLRQSASGVGAWIAAFWRETPPALALVRSFEAMGVGGAYPPYLLEIGSIQNVVRAPALWLAARVAGAALAVLLVGLGAAVSGRDRGERGAIARIGVFSVLPLALPWAASFVRAPIYLVGRYEMVAFMGFTLVAARGLGAIAARTRAGAAVAGAAWLALAGLSLGATIAQEAGGKGISEWLAQVAKPGDAIVFPGYTRTVPEYYLARWNVPGERVSFPGEIASHFGWFDYEAAARADAETTAEARALAGRLAGERSGRVILVVDQYPHPDIQRVFHRLRSALVDSLGRPVPVGSPGAIPTFEVYARR